MGFSSIVGIDSLGYLKQNLQKRTSSSQCSSTHSPVVLLRLLAPLVPVHPFVVAPVSSVCRGSIIRRCSICLSRLHSSSIRRGSIVHRCSHPFVVAPVLVCPLVVVPVLVSPFPSSCQSGSSPRRSIPQSPSVCSPWLQSSFVCSPWLQSSSVPSLWLQSSAVLPEVVVHSLGLTVLLVLLCCSRSSLCHGLQFRSSWVFDGRLLLFLLPLLTSPRCG
jgi:hypothetical protein